MCVYVCVRAWSRRGFLVYLTVCVCSVGVAVCLE